MRFTATRDPLTTLWNRGVILELLERELVRSHREQVSGDTLFRRPPERFPSR
jgi:GGDEF domain-containing protein